MNPGCVPETVTHRSALRRWLLTLGAVALTVMLVAVAGAAVQAQSDDQEGYIYVVVQGDSWTGIAEATGLTVAELQAVNRRATRANGWLLIGEEIFVPAPAPPAQTDETAGEAGGETAETPEAETTPEPEATIEPTATYTQTYVVGAGESWNSIANDLGIDVEALRAANPEAVRADDILYRGLTLKVPAAEEATPEASPEGADSQDAGAGEADAPQPDGAEADTAEAAAEEAGADEEPVAEEADSDGPAEGEQSADEAPETADAETDAAATEDVAAEPPAEDEMQTYAVQPADSWNSIARQFGVTAAALQAANPALVRAGEVLFAGDELSIPAAADEQADDGAAAEMPACPETFAEYPEALNALLNADEGNPDVLADFLAACGAQTADGVTAQDWTGDSVDDLVVIYGDPATEGTAQMMDLIIFNGDGTGYETAYRARAAGSVDLLATEDVNVDDQADVVWIDTTCGESTCFDTVNVVSWDGSAWSDWTDGAITMAYANVDLDDLSERGQGAEIVVTGGVYGSAGAGPQRSRIDTWGSVEGAPYTMIDQAFSPSECLYHTVLDGNRSLLNAPEEGFGAAEAYYTDAISNDALIKCWVHDNELEELRSFSYFRLALIAGYQNLPEVAGDLVSALNELYPESAYAGLAQTWFDSYTAENDMAAACAEANAYAEENPETWEMLADYGYTNPTFSAQEVCPVLGLGGAQDETEPAADGAAQDQPEQGNAEAEATEDTASEDTTAEDGAVEEGAEEAPADAAEGSEAEAESATDGAEDAAAVAGGTAAAAGEAATEAEAGADAETAAPECPPNVDRFARVLPDVIATMDGDMAQVEAWLAGCDAVVEGEQVAVTADLNEDGVDDLVFFPTIVSDLGFGPGGSQGAVLVYHGQEDGSYELAYDPEIYGQPTLLAIEDLNEDGRVELAWAVASCANFCVIEVQMIAWDGGDYVTAIEPGATIAEGRAYFESLGSEAVGAGQALVLEGGVSGMPDGGLATGHSEVWQSVEDTPYGRVEWIYDREADGNDCLGLRLIEADMALQAADVLGYGEAIDLYIQSLNPTLQACSLFGMPAEEELILLQGLASFRLTQAQALNGDMDAAQATLLALQAGQPDGGYTQAAGEWLDAYIAAGDAAAACAAVESIFVENEELWQITDHYGYNHPALPAQQICFVPQ